jgi:hypothetical protein
MRFSGDVQTVNSKESLDKWIRFSTEIFHEKHYVTFKYSLGKPRTIKQNSAMWVFCRDIADRCNAAGYEMQTTSPVLSKPIETPWTDRSVMDNIWMTVQTAMFPEKTDSSDELDTKEVAPVAETIIRHLGNTYGIHVLFPTKAFKDGN